MIWLIHFLALYICSFFVFSLFKISKLAKSSVAFNFRKCNSFELYTQDGRAEMIKEHHDGQPVSEHKIWIFKPLR